MEIQRDGIKRLFLIGFPEKVYQLIPGKLQRFLQNGAAGGNMSVNSGNDLYAQSLCFVDKAAAVAVYAGIMVKPYLLGIGAAFYHRGCDQNVAEAIGFVVKTTGCDTHRITFRF